MDVWTVLSSSELLDALYNQQGGEKAFLALCKQKLKAKIIWNEAMQVYSVKFDTTKKGA